MDSFRYINPTTIEDAVEALNEIRGAVPLAGGTALLAAMRRGACAPECIVDLDRVAGLDRIAFDPEQGMRIGATATVYAVEQNEDIATHYPVLNEIARRFAPLQVRGTATLVGNICNATPDADFAGALIAYAADVVVYGPEGEKRIAVDTFLHGGGKNMLGHGELVKEVILPTPSPDSYSASYNHKSWPLYAPSLAGAAAQLQIADGTIKEARLGLIGAGERPLRATEAEAALEGMPLHAETIEKAAEVAAAEVDPYSDFRASAEYRRVLVSVAVRRTLSQILAQSNERAALE